MTPIKIKRKLSECSKDELIELLYEAVKANKDTQAYVSVKLEGEPVLLEIVDASKERIYKEFYPTRGFPKLRVSKIEQVLSEIKTIGKGTIWPFELRVYFCEVAVQYIHEQADIFEDMGDCFTETYEEVVQILNKEKKPDLYEKYKDRLKAIVHTPGCECWGIHDSLEGSYSDLKWVDHDEEEDDLDHASSVISYAAMSKWLKVPEDARQKYISNVWCGRCLGTTTIRDFSIQLDTYGIILQGSCSNCGHQVARVIE
ncbi:DUF6155 family protein [Bacillus horti]|uniref:Phage protein n=1 Tax=Caldalkalibacillus horti TaxID=77523 RepID=A0ABT9W1Z2_9BACI|nr:DUF6155 family protein [Bacillus horti]MDQ0167271.1 hypothetical protein [Bacillus horti]